MEKIVLDFILRSQLTAGPKAREDVNYILEQRGYHIKKIIFSKNSIVKSLLSLMSLAFRIPYGSNVLIQYPLGNISSSFFVIKLLRILRCNITLLIHDLESLRNTGRLSAREIRNQRMADKLVVQTNRMKVLLVDNGVEADKMKVLQLFDYRVDVLKDFSTQDVSGGAVVFAGNLNKSPFIKKMNGINCHFKVYGVYDGCISDFTAKNIEYAGAFSPSDLNSIKGKWGLVWDGDSINTCSDALGNYLRFNAPHKLSLYVVSGLPVIVWKESAESAFVCQYNIGLSVETLEDLNRVLESVTPDDYNMKKDAVRKLAAKLVKGDMLLDALCR